MRSPFSAIPTSTARLTGDAVTVLGNVELGPHAEIGGNVVAVGGTRAARPRRNRSRQRPEHHCRPLRQRRLAAQPGSIIACSMDGRWRLQPGWAGHGDWRLPSWRCMWRLALLFRDGLIRCVQTFETQPGQSVLAALIAMLLTPVLLVLLFVTVIGIAAVPFVVFGLFCAGLFGKAVMLAWLGRRITGRQGQGSASHPAVAVLIGGLLVLVLYLVPVIGFLVYKLLGILGLGAVVYTVLLTLRAHQAAKAAPSAAPAAPAAPVAPAEPAARGPIPMPGLTPGPTPPPAPDPAPAAGATFSATAAASAAPEAATARGPGSRGPAPPMRLVSARPATAAAARQPVSAALPRAGFWIRMAALLLDVVLVGFFMGLFHHAHLRIGGIGRLRRGDVEGSRLDHRRHRVRFACGAAGRAGGRLGDGDHACPRLLFVLGGGRPWVHLDSLRQAITRRGTTKSPAPWWCGWRRPRPWYNCGMNSRRTSLGCKSGCGDHRRQSPDRRAVDDQHRYRRHRRHGGAGQGTGARRIRIGARSRSTTTNPLPRCRTSASDWTRSTSPRPWSAIFTSTATSC